jgi:hypothetical protein
VERFNRTLHNRMGLPTGLHQQPATHRRPAIMARLLQPPTQTQLPRTAPTHQPSDTNLMAGYT